MNTILNLLSSIGTAVAGFFNWKTSKVAQRRALEEDLNAKESEKAKLKSEIAKAVHTGDDEKLNEIVSRLLPMFLCVFLFSVISGCIGASTVIKYIPTDRKIESCTNSIGIACKAVPNAVFEELLSARIELDYLRKEMKIDKQLSK